MNIVQELKNQIILSMKTKDVCKNTCKVSYMVSYTEHTLLIFGFGLLICTIKMTNNDMIMISSLCLLTNT